MGTRLPILICVSEEVHGSHGTRKGATKGQKQALKKGGGGGATEPKIQERRRAR